MAIKRIHRTQTTHAAKRIYRQPTAPVYMESTGETPGARAKFKRWIMGGYEYYQTIWVCDEDLANKHGPRVGDKYRREYDAINFKHGLWERLK